MEIFPIFIRMEIRRDRLMYKNILLGVDTHIKMKSFRSCF